MNGARLRSLRNKLALLFFGIVALAFGLVFFLVVPQLQSSLEDQQLDDLERAARATAGQLERAQERAIPAAELDELVRAVADASGAQVTLLGVQEGDDVLFYPISDSQAQRLEELPDEAAAEAFETRSAGPRDVRLRAASTPRRSRGRCRATGRGSPSTRAASTTSPRRST